MKISNKINDLARELMNNSEYYYQLEQEGNSPEYIFAKAQEEAGEILMKQFVQKLKDDFKNLGLL